MCLISFFPVKNFRLIFFKISTLQSYLTTLPSAFFQQAASILEGVTATIFPNNHNEGIHAKKNENAYHAPRIHSTVVITRLNRICWVMRIARWRSAASIDPAALDTERVPVASERKVTVYPR